MRPLANDFVMTFHGDTPKSPNTPGGWPDGTPNGSNWMYVLGNGHLYSGWFGGVDRNGNAKGFDANGNDAAVQRGEHRAHRDGRRRYAIAKGDDRSIAQFGANGIKIADVFGYAKVQ